MHYVGMFNINFNDKYKMTSSNCSLIAFNKEEVKKNSCGQQFLILYCTKYCRKRVV